MLKQRFTTLTRLRIQPYGIIACIAAALFISGVAFAAGKTKAGTPPDTKNENTPIQITAKQLISNNEGQYVEFIGDVKATQADFVITSDLLRIYYRGNLLNNEEQSDDEEMLQKIVATGNVKIRTDQYSAETEKVECDTAAMTIILIGEDSRVYSGKNSITGSKIILYRRDGRVKVLGSKNKRIKAEFFSKGNTSDAFKMGKPENSPLKKN